LYKLKHVLQRIREWWHDETVLISDGKHKKIIDLRDCTAYVLTGKQVGNPEKRKVSPKGNSVYSITLPEQVGIPLTDSEGFTEIIQVKIDGTENFVAVLSKPKGSP
jgi:hypothetical protein